MVILPCRAPENIDDISGKEPRQDFVEKEEGREHKISDYELSREERIRENRERMQKLGLFGLSQNLNALKPTRKRASHQRTPKSYTPLSPPGPVRRSSRLHNSTPVSYCEVHVTKKEKSLNDDTLSAEGSRPEVYTEEHEKLLGSTEMGWTLFVDGYGKDGKRIYDPLRGKTCHQCRQKTLGHRTHCCKCNMVQGQFCGDCLYMRYGENVFEAKANPNWICPVCRGICNCSLCRQAKGWAPTGILYKRISSLGYKSVAHYLIQTRRATTESETCVGSHFATSAKRSLPFTDLEETRGDDDPSIPSSESLKPDLLSVSDEEFDDSIAPEIGVEPLLSPPIPTFMKDHVKYPLKSEREIFRAGCEDNKTKYLVDGELGKSDIEPKTVAESEPAKEPFNYLSLNECSNLQKDEGLKPETPEGGYECQIKKEKFILVAVEETPKYTKKRVRYEPKPDSIAGRLRQRRNGANT